MSRAIHYAYKSTSLDGVVVSTESPKIISEIHSTFQKLHPGIHDEDFNLEGIQTHPFIGYRGSPVLLLHQRSSSLAQDHSLISDTLETVHSILGLKFPDEDIYLLLLQPTTPFRGIEEIDNFLAGSKMENSYSPCVSVTKVDDFHP